MRPVLDLAALGRRCRAQVDLAEGYARLRAMGFEYGPLFQSLAELRIEGREALARIEAPGPVAAEIEEYQIHPSLLDACFQGLILLAADSGGEHGTYMPSGIDRMVIYGRTRATSWSHIRLTRWGDLRMEGDITLVDADGRVVAEIEGVHVRSIERAQGASEEDVDDLLFDIEWQPYEQPAAEAAAQDDAAWVVFADRGGLGDELAARIEARGRHVLRVRIGERFAVDEREAVVDPARPEHFDLLLDEVAHQPSCSGMVHLWSLDAPAGEEIEAEALLAAQDAGPIAVLHLIQALNRTGWHDTPSLTLVTRGAQRLADDAAPAAVAQSPLWGFGRSAFHQEHPELHGRLIDLDPTVRADEAETLLALLENRDGEDQIAWRGGARFRARLVPAPARDTAALVTTSAPRFRADGTYLITGGLGLTFARWLVERGARRLILMGRTALAPRETWNEVDRESSAGHRIRAVRELESLGASVHTAAVDVTDGVALKAYLESYRREGWPPIRGVVHSAGVARPQLLLHMDAEDLRWAMIPKLVGGWHLHRALGDEPLEFFVLMSSVISLGMSMGMSGYAAANAALDGLAHYRRGLALPAMSVNWGPWAEVGMASADELSRDLANRGFLSMTPGQGLHRPEPPLACPILAFGGSADRLVSAEEIEAWRQETGAAFTRRSIPGDHFFLRTAETFLVRLIAHELRSLATSAFPLEMAS